MADRFRLSRLILTFSAIFAATLISPAFLSNQFTFFPLLKVGDVTDTLTPIILIPLYWLMFQVRPIFYPNKRESLVFVASSALFAQGQGMHLAANSIGHLLDSNPAGDVYNLTYFFDERLGHILGFLGLIGLTSCLILRQLRNPFEKGENLYLETLAGIIYGLTYFIIVTEGQLALLGIPYAILVITIGIIYAKDSLKRQPLVLFFLISHTLSLVFFLSWFIYWGGHLLQFSEVGIIK